MKKMNLTENEVFIPEGIPQKTKKTGVVLVVLSLLIIGVVCLVFWGINKNINIERDIGFVKEIFSNVNVDTLKEAHEVEQIENEYFQMQGTFANVKGTYEIETYGKNGDGFEAKNIYNVKFKWDYNQEVPLEEVVTAMTEYLGAYEDNVDEEMGYYCWHGTEQTQFSKAPTANSFNIQIFGDDRYISFGLYTR